MYRLQTRTSGTFFYRTVTRPISTPRSLPTPISTRAPSALFAAGNLPMSFECRGLHYFDTARLQRVPGIRGQSGCLNPRHRA